MVCTHSEERPDRPSTSVLIEWSCIGFAQRPFGYQQLRHSKHKDKMPTEPYLQYLVRLFNDVLDSLQYCLVKSDAGATRTRSATLFQTCWANIYQRIEIPHIDYTHRKDNISLTLSSEFRVPPNYIYIYIHILYRLKTYFHLTGDPSLPNTYNALFVDHTKRVVNFRRGRISRGQIKIRHTYLQAHRRHPYGRISTGGLK